MSPGTALYSRMHRWPSRPVVSLGTAALALALGWVGAPGAQRGQPTADDQHKTWKDYAGGADSSKFVALDQITKANVGQLTVAWTYNTDDTLNYQFNPVIVDNVMYVLAKNSSLVALDATTGREIWIHANLRGIARRGINYWESVDRKDRRLLFQMNNHLQAIDAQTGKSILTFGRNGLVDLREGLGRDPQGLRAQSNTPGRIFENLILLGSATGEGYLSAPGHLRAYDVVTGRLVWTFHTIPQPGEVGYDTWPTDAWRYVGGANTWGEITVDVARGIAYFPTGSPTYDYYGADRIGSNLFANCLLALDARTGKRLWHFQTVHHDLWDYDLTAAPQLVTIRRNGKTIDAVAQATKQGFLFVFDRVSGEPVFPIEERPVPKSDVPGEQAWPTQPFPTVLPPFARQTMTENDITPYFLSPDERATWVARLTKARKGLFNPPSTEETVAVPGAVGGANWGNTAANPSEGLVYVMSQDFPSFYTLSTTAGPGAAGAAGGARGAPGAGGRAGGSGPEDRGRTSYDQNCQACHGADRSGSAGGPTLVGMGSRLGYQDFRQLILAGRGRMPALPNIDDQTMSALFAFLGGSGAPAGRGAAAAADRLPSGPVVASGGAPGGLDVQAGTGAGGGRGSSAYPPGVDAPSVRYYTGYGLGFPHIMSAPWSRILAYDLNTGTIEWQVPLGVDRLAAAQGGGDSGVPRGAQRMGMIVTSTGLLFATAKDGKIRAYSADSGKVLWTGDLPHGTEGLPAMYEVNGRQYLVVCATTGLTWGPKSREGGPWTQGEAGSAAKDGYIVFALPSESQ